MQPPIFIISCKLKFQLKYAIIVVSPNKRKKAGIWKTLFTAWIC